MMQCPVSANFSQPSTENGLRNFPLQRVGHFALASPESEGTSSDEKKPYHLDSDTVSSLTETYKYV